MCESVRPPAWLLGYLGRARGARHPKMVHLVVYKNGWDSRHLPMVYKMGQNSPQKCVKSPPNFPLGNLSLNEYRFWIGTALENAAYAACRFCHVLCCSEEERKTHQKMRGCTVKLVSVYSLLQKDAKCVVCDKPSVTSRWGLPLHRECIEAWMFGKKTPKSLKQAIRLATKQGYIKP